MSFRKGRFEVFDDTESVSASAVEAPNHCDEASTVSTRESAASSAASPLEGAALRRRRATAPRPKGGRGKGIALTPLRIATAPEDRLPSSPAPLVSQLSPLVVPPARPSSPPPAASPPSADCVSSPSPKASRRRVTNKTLSPKHRLQFASPFVQANATGPATMPSSSRRATNKDARVSVSVARHHAPDDAATSSPSAISALAAPIVKNQQSQTEAASSNLESPPTSPSSSVVIRRRSCPPKKLGRFMVADYHETPSPFKRPLLPASSSTTSLSAGEAGAPAAAAAPPPPSPMPVEESESPLCPNASTAERPHSPVVLGHSLSPVPSTIPEDSELGCEPSGAADADAPAPVPACEAGAPSSTMSVSSPISRPISPMAGSLLDDGPEFFDDDDEPPCVQLYTAGRFAVAEEMSLAQEMEIVVADKQQRKEALSDADASPTTSPAKAEPKSHRSRSSIIVSPRRTGGDSLRKRISFVEDDDALDTPKVATRTKQIGRFAVEEEVTPPPHASIPRTRSPLPPSGKLTEQRGRFAVEEEEMSAEEMLEEWEMLEERRPSIVAIVTPVVTSSLVAHASMPLIHSRPVASAPMPPIVASESPVSKVAVATGSSPSHRTPLVATTLTPAATMTSSSLSKPKRPVFAASTSKAIARAAAHAHVAAGAEPGGGRRAPISRCHTDTGVLSVRSSNNSAHTSSSSSGKSAAKGVVVRPTKSARTRAATLKRSETSQRLATQPFAEPFCAPGSSQTSVPKRPPDVGAERDRRRSTSAPGRSEGNPPDAADMGMVTPDAPLEEFPSNGHASICASKPVAGASSRKKRSQTVTASVASAAPPRLLQRSNSKPLLIPAMPATLTLANGPSSQHHRHTASEKPHAAATNTGGHSSSSSLRRRRGAPPSHSEQRPPTTSTATTPLPPTSTPAAASGGNTSISRAVPSRTQPPSTHSVQSSSSSPSAPSSSDTIVSPLDASSPSSRVCIDASLPAPSQAPMSSPSSRQLSISHKSQRFPAVARRSQAKRQASQRPKPAQHPPQRPRPSNGKPFSSKVPPARAQRRTTAASRHSHSRSLTHRSMASALAAAPKKGGGGGGGVPISAAASASRERRFGRFCVVEC